MKYAVDVQQRVTCALEVVVEADNAHTAGVAATIMVERCLDGRTYLDRKDWDTIVLDGDLSTADTAKGLGVERLLDRRTRERAEGLRSDASCDACDAKSIRTARYGAARVCSQCLAALPPLAG